MSTKNARIVYRTNGGSWSNRRTDASKAGSTHHTQHDAIAAATRMLERVGGGELLVKGRDGRIRSKDTVGGGNDPTSVRDREH